MADRRNDLKCHICGRTFRLRISLKVHISTHKQDGVLEEKYAEGANTTGCVIQEESLKVVEKRNNPEQCQYCGEQFSLPFSLMAHVIDCTAKSSDCNDTLAKRFPSSEIGNESSIKEENTFRNESDTEMHEIPNQVESDEEVNLVITEPHFVEIPTDVKPPLDLSEMSVKKKKRKYDEQETDLLGSVDTDVESGEEGQEVDEAGMFRCKTCGKSFTKPGQLKRHMKYHTSEFKCPTCEKVFLSQFVLSQHVESKNCSDEGKTCTHCSRKYTTKAILVRHIRRAHSGKVEKSQTAQCDVCNKFVAKSNLELHKRIHTGERPHQCEFCGASFVQKHHLQRHRVVHTEPSFQCKVCSVNYTQEETLHKHILKFHPEKDIEECVELQSRYEMKKCSQCDLQFSNQILLGRHEITAHSVQPLEKKCSHCGKSFPNHAQRRYHERIHTGEKPEKCSFCDKSFRLPKSLKDHLRTHTKERPFNCKTCGKSFTQKPHLLAHQILHTGEKPYLCSHCGKAFANQSNLRVHEKKSCKQIKSA